MNYALLLKRYKFPILVSLMCSILIYINRIEFRNKYFPFPLLLSEKVAFRNKRMSN